MSSVPLRPRTAAPSSFTSRPVPAAATSSPTWPGSRRYFAGFPSMRFTAWEADGANDGGAQPHRQLASLLSQVAKRKRYRIWSQLVAAAAAVFALAAAAGYGVLGTSSRQLASSPLPGSMTVRGSNPQTGATAVVTYAGRPWGVQLYVQVKGIAAGTHCMLEVTDSGGHESEAANWTVARGDETARYMASSSVPVTRLRGFVVTAKGLALVRVDARVPRPRIAGPR
jgi:hypothetical protein